MNTNNKSLLGNVRIDQDLTPSNSSIKGYKWIKDTVFTPLAPSLFKEVNCLIEKGYCLGQPTIQNASKICVGLYCPI